MREERGSTKRRIVEATYEMILEGGLESVTAREVTKRVGVSATMIYKHFENLTYLTVIASIRYIQDYFNALKELYNEDEDYIQMDLNGWRNFCNFAFKNPPIYENLFWGTYNKNLEDALMDFYEIFPEELPQKNAAFMVYSLFSSSIEERDFLWLRRAANRNLIEYDNAKFVARTNCLICRGCLLEHFKDYTEPRISENAADECYNLIYKNIMTYVK